MDIQRITLDVSKSPVEHRVIRIGERDKNGTTLIVAVTDHGQALNIGNLSASLLIKFSDEAMYEIAGTASGSQATFVIDAQDMQAGYTSNACVSLAGDDFILSTSRFAIEVLESAEVS